MQQFQTPILFTIFNRPDETTRVFAEIKKQKPKYLFISADGPRNISEKFKTDETRDIISKIDWDCTVKTKFEDENLGCKMAMYSAINWFFENVEKGIILEDDCLPHPDFFRFCEQLLEKYDDNQKVMMISGDNFQDDIKRGEASYYFSKFGHIWGWATWRNRWKLYDLELKDLDGPNISHHIDRSIPNKKARASFIDSLKKVKSGKLDTWDYGWLYTIWKNNGVAVLPNVNLVSNIGHNQNATHTKNPSKKADRQTVAIGIITHPSKIESNYEADQYTFRQFFGETMSDRIRRYIERIWR